MTPKLGFVVGFLLMLAEAAYASKAALFIFGASVVDTGNNNYLNTSISFKANFPPYGETFFHRPTGRFSDGRLFSDFIAEHANLPLITPYYQPGNHELIHGINFASSGSGSLVGTFQGSAINLHEQLANFKRVKQQLVEKLGLEEANKLVANAVYFISHGTNDYTFPFLTNTSSSFFQANPPQQYVDAVVGNMSSVIKGIYGEGGRKIGITNVPPLSCYPVIRALNYRKVGECVPELVNLVTLHNVGLAESLKKLEEELEGFKYSLFDLNLAVADRMNNPSKYGFKDTKTACCGSGPLRGYPTCGRGPGPYELCEEVGDHLFWDSVHICEKAYEQISELLWTGTGGFATPYGLKGLFELVNSEGAHCKQAELKLELEFL